MAYRLSSIAVETCEMHIVGHKIFVRLKDIPMYLSKKTKDSIRNRYSHSVEVGLSTEYILNHISRELGTDVDMNFFKIGKIIGLLHDIGHTAFSHDGEVILDKMLKEASRDLKSPVRFNANLNNFRRIEKYALLDVLPEDIRRYALASLVKRKKELVEYPEYYYLNDDLQYALALEKNYLSSKGIKITSTSTKTILCQAMDLADENRYRVTDIIDALNIYSKHKLREILMRSVHSEVRVKDIKKVTPLHLPSMKNSTKNSTKVHHDKMSIKEVLLILLQQESNAKTDFQNVMNTLSMAFNRNISLSDKGKLVFVDMQIEQLRSDFHNIAATYIWGSKKVKNIKKPFNHYFKTVSHYFIYEKFDIDMIDSITYKNELLALGMATINVQEKKKEKLKLLRNFLGGLTNYKIMEIYKKIKLSQFEEELGYKLKKRVDLIDKTTMPEFDKKMEKYRKRFFLVQH